MKKENVIKSCYSILRKTTPLSFDCGTLCGGKCCKGDENTGMIIFPGEENLIDSKIKIITNEYNDKVAVCGGLCDRNKRPLSCRIYPLFPIIHNENNEEKIKAVFDYRGDCPLKSGEYKFDRRFVKAVKRVGKYLLLNEETAAYYRELCDMFNEHFELVKKFR